MNTFTLLFSSLILSLTSIAHSTDVSEAPRSLVSIVQPIILCDDDGLHQARYAIPARLINRAYTKADLDFVFLPTKKWNNSKARQGKINLDKILTDGRSTGIISSDPRILTLLFVSAVDGRRGPLGRGLQNGNVCFVCLGAKEKMTTTTLQAFVIAHEVGHCFNLKHTVDDPAVPNDIPNLEGDGPFEKRIAPDGLHASQVKTIQASPLSILRLQFHSKEETSQLLIQDKWGNNPHDLHDTNIRFQLGLSAETQIPTENEKRHQFINQHFSNSARSFTENEISTLTRLTKKLDQLLASSVTFGGKNNLLNKLPWHFLKVKQAFCNGYPHTRGLSIVLSSGAIEMMENNETQALTILLHEKFHVLQRLSMTHMQSTFKRYGFRRATLEKGEFSRLQLITNPDTPPPFWALELDGKLHLLGTTLDSSRTPPQFKETLLPLQPSEHGYIAQKPISEPAELTQWKSKFPIPTGFDDPREIQAYLVTEVFKKVVLGITNDKLSAAQRLTLEQEEQSLPSILSPQDQNPLQ